MLYTNWTPAQGRSNPGTLANRLPVGASHDPRRFLSGQRSGASPSLSNSDRAIRSATPASPSCCLNRWPPHPTSVLSITSPSLLLSQTNVLLTTAPTEAMLPARVAVRNNVLLTTLPARHGRACSRRRKTCLLQSLRHPSRTPLAFLPRGRRRRSREQTAASGCTPRRRSFTQRWNAKTTTRRRRTCVSLYPYITLLMSGRGRRF